MSNASGGGTDKSIVTASGLQHFTAGLLFMVKGERMEEKGRRTNAKRAGLRGEESR